MAVFSKFNDWELSNYLPFVKKIGGFAPQSQKKMYNLDSASSDLRFRDLGNELYKIIREDSVQFERPDRMPMINFSHDCTDTAITLGFPESLIINHPKYAEDTHKDVMHKRLIDKDYVPKTVFTIEDAIKDLKFPVIGKVAGSGPLAQEAKGVFQFKTPEDLKGKDAKQCDIFSEKIDIDKEFRMVVYTYKNGSTKLIYLAERIPNGEKIKSLREGQNLDFLHSSSEKESNFEWELLNLNTEVYSAQISNIVQDCVNLNPNIQLLGIDFCIDKAGKFWYIELNMHPGMNYYLPISLYAHAYIDYYDDLNIQDKNSASYQYLLKVAKKHIEYTNAISPEYNIPKFEPNILGKFYFNKNK